LEVFGYLGAKLV